jgi:cytochrome c-type biogenesis protein CcmH/NrfF
MAIRRVALLVPLVALVTAAGLLVVHRGSREGGLDTRVAAVAATLRCPSCEGESVSSSNAPIARSMRAEIRTQLRHGRTPEQVRAWFERRYGRGVVLLPGSSGGELALWLAPFLALATGGALLLGRRRRVAAPARARALPRGRLALAAVSVVAVGVGVPLAARGGAPAADTASAAPEPAATTGPSGTRPGMNAAGWAQVGRSLDDQHDYGGAVKAYRRALALDHGAAAVRIRLALDLIREDRAAAAEPLVRRLADTAGPSRSAALLVLGLAQRAQGDPVATRTLRRFLTLAPHHPAADQVRRLLREPS